MERKIKDIQAHFAALLGERIARYETAEQLLSDGSWESWPDLPIRFYTESGRLVAISWSRFDDLWLTDGPSFRPCSVMQESGGSPTDWKRSMPPSGPRSSR